MNEFYPTSIDSPRETHGENDAILGGNANQYSVAEQEPKNPAEMLVGLSLKTSESIGHEAMEGAGVSAPSVEQVDAQDDDEDVDMLDQPGDDYSDVMPFDEAAYQVRLGAAKKDYIRGNNIDLPAANERFESEAAAFISGIRDRATSEGRELNEDETRQIKNVAELIKSQRELAKDVAFDDFEARAPEMVQKIRAEADAEGRELRDDEKAKIRNIVRVITEHRAKQSA